jgi:hypothetical protein
MNPDSHRFAANPQTLIHSSASPWEASAESWPTPSCPLRIAQPEDGGVDLWDRGVELRRPAGWGWALRDLRGGFAALDSNRIDVKYERFRGHCLTTRCSSCRRWTNDFQPNASPKPACLEQEKGTC